MLDPDRHMHGLVRRLDDLRCCGLVGVLLDAIDAARQTQGAIIVDLSEARLVDHTVLQRLETRRERGDLEWVGLDGHRTLGAHPLATRVRRPADESVPASEASDPRR